MALSLYLEQHTSNLYVHKNAHSIYFIHQVTLFTRCNVMGNFADISEMNKKINKFNFPSVYSFGMEE